MAESSKASEAGYQVTVRARGLSRVDLRLLGLVALLSPIDVALIVFLTIGGWRSDTPIKAVLAVSAIAFIGLMFLEISSYPRKVDISSKGLQFRYRLHRERVEWADIEPLVRPAKGGFHGGSWLLAKHSVRRNGRIKSRAFWLTAEQTAAILQYPSGRIWSRTEDVDRLLRGDLPQTVASTS